MLQDWCFTLVSQFALVAVHNVVLYILQGEVCSKYASLVLKHHGHNTVLISSILI